MESNTKQLQIAEAFQGVSKYDPQSAKYKLTTGKLALFVGATNVLLSLVENQQFKEFVSELDKRYKVPSRAKIGKEIERVLADLTFFH